MLTPAFDLAKYPTVDTIQLLASLLERMTAANDQLHKAALSRKDIRRSSSAAPLGAYAVPMSSSTEPYTRFHARSIPSIDIYSYLSRILKYCPCANECFLSLLVYFDRMSKNALTLTGRPFTIDSYNVHRLIIAGVMVSSKFFSDVFYTNTRYAKVGGLPVSELNSLELEFLRLNSFNLSVPIAELQRYGDQLLKVGLLRKSVPCNPVRHGRSTSLGSNALACHDQEQQRRSFDQQTVERLCDLTSRVSLDEQDPGRRGIASAQRPYPDMRRMGSAGSLRQPSPHPFYKPADAQAQQHSPITTVADPDHHALHRPQRHSLGDWQKSPTVQWQHFGKPIPTPPVLSNNPSDGTTLVNDWRVPRQSRSSINLYQQGTWMTGREDTNGSPNQKSPSSSGPRRLSLSSIHAPPFIPQRPASTEMFTTPYGYYTVPYLGIPTPPPSSSPLHKQPLSSPTAAQQPQTYPAMYL